MKKQRDLLYLSASCFVIIVAWVGFHIYNIYVTSTVSQDLQGQSIPIDPHFDTDLIAKIKTRQQVAPVYTVPKQEIVPTQTPIITPTDQTQSASSSGIPTLLGQ